MSYLWNWTCWTCCPVQFWHYLLQVQVLMFWITKQNRQNMIPKVFIERILFSKHIEESTHHDQDLHIHTQAAFIHSKKFLLHDSVFYPSGILYLICLGILLQLTGLEERPDLHADGLEWVPASFPVHPHHTIICAVLSHVPGVRSPNVVSAIGISWVAAVVPPPTSVLSGTLFGRISRIPVLNKKK